MSHPILAVRLNQQIHDLLDFVTKARGVDQSKYTRAVLVRALRAELDSMCARHETPTVDSSELQFGPRAHTCE